MAPLTSFRHRFAPAPKLQANSWMLMTGSLGMLASTLPVQWLLPSIGWRGLFRALAACLALAVAAIAWRVPRDAGTGAAKPVQVADHRAIVGHASFLRLLPMGFIHCGGLIAVQSPRAGPWLTEVGGASADEAAHGPFVTNFSMLLALLARGLAMPRQSARGWTAQALIARRVPVSLALPAAVAAPVADAATWTAWCVSCTRGVGVAAGGRPGLRPGTRRPRAVGLQPRDLHRSFRRAVGHRPGGRPDVGLRDVDGGVVPDGVFRLRRAARSSVRLDPAPW
jgi:predicted MFS family arabinose efflux permease